MQHNISGLGGDPDRVTVFGFATNGDPGWPSFDTGSTRLFDIDPAVTEYPEQVSRQIWRDHPSVLDLKTRGEHARRSMA